MKNGILFAIWRFEVKKLFFRKVNLIAMAASSVMLVFLTASSFFDEPHVSREAAEDLNGRLIDGQMAEEMKPFLKTENGEVITDGSEESEKYIPVKKVFDVMSRAVGQETGLSYSLGDELYAYREAEIDRLMEAQGLSEKEKEYWQEKEALVSKPFLYRYHSGPANLLRSFQALGFFIMILSAVGLSGVYAGEAADQMNQLLLCSRYGRRELYAIKLFAGFTWILTAAMITFLSVMVPFGWLYGMEGMGEMVQLVKPLTLFPISIGQMIMIYSGVFVLGACMFAAVTMLLSVITLNQSAVISGLSGYILADLFLEFPDGWNPLQKIWSLRPNAVLMNSGFSNYRLIHLAGGLFPNIQAAPVLYIIVIIAAVLGGWLKYRRLQIGNGR